MAELFNVSDGVRLGLHAALLLARSPGRLTINELAQQLGGSAAHLAKILTQLERAGIVHAKSGPGGGYQLTRPPEQISLLSVYEAVAGHLNVDRCPFAVPVCNGEGCPLGPFFRRLNREIITRLEKSSLKTVKIKLGGFSENQQKKTPDNHHR
jgi:Rrf2 family protein